MLLKKGFYILLISILAISFSSCLGSDDNVYDDYALNDAQLVTLSFSHDSIPDLANVIFSIDQKAGLIYNYDSMAYGTDIYEKVKMKYVSGANTDNLMNITGGDSVRIAQDDSVDVSKPLIFKVYALDGVTTKTYSFQLNIHQIDPDSIQYQRIASNLSFLEGSRTKAVYFNKTFYVFSVKDDIGRVYTSGDAVTWNEQTLSGFPKDILIESVLSSKQGIYACTEGGEFLISYDGLFWNKVPTEYPVKNILGFLKETRDNYGQLLQKEGLSLIVRKENEYVFAFTNDLQNWSYGTSVPQRFPVSGFSYTNLEISKVQRLLLAGGITSSGSVINSVWSTDNGLYWAMFGDDRYNILPEITDANLFFYDGKICLINGVLTKGYYNPVFYYSTDNGFTWKEGPDKCKMPSDYSLRMGASLIVDEEGKSFYIIGGSNQSFLSDIWKGFMNKKFFNH